jgi:hypothetical protein
MSADRDLMLDIRGWLAADERDLPRPVRASVMAAIADVPQRRQRWLRPWPSLWARQGRLRSIAILGLLIALLALLAVAWIVPFGSSSPESAHVENGWIAFSTQGHAGQIGSTDYRKGGDIYIAHDHDDLRMLVSRGPDMDRNVCPAFSPDGTQLAFGQLSRAGPAIVILDLAPDGTITDSTRLPVASTNTEAPCPRWSADGSRIGSLEYRNLVVIHGLDGSILEATAGDPSFADFPGPDDWRRPLLSPSGEYSVSGIYERGVVLSPVDGSPDRLITQEQYAIWGWSPDSTKVLLMRDVSGASFTLWAASVEPYTLEVIAEDIPTNGARSWPDRRDVSWQALIE